MEYENISPRHVGGHVAPPTFPQFPRRGGFALRSRPPTEVHEVLRSSHSRSETATLLHHRWMRRTFHFWCRSGVYFQLFANRLPATLSVHVCVFAHSINSANGVARERLRNAHTWLRKLIENNSDITGKYQKINNHCNIIMQRHLDEVSISK